MTTIKGILSILNETYNTLLFLSLSHREIPSYKMIELNYLQIRICIINNSAWQEYVRISPLHTKYMHILCAHVNMNILSINVYIYKGVICD